MTTTELLDRPIDVKVKGYPAQMEFIQSVEFELAMIAGLGSGKSHAGCIKSLVYCLKNPGAWGIVTAPQNRILEMATIPTYEKIFPPELISNKRMRPHPEWALRNGCKIFFWSTDKPETISGAELAFGHMDEGSLSPYQSYVNIKKRLRQVNSAGKPFPYQLWITTTPRQLNWLYQEVTDKTNPMKFVTATTMDNIYLDDAEGYINRLGLTGKEYEQEILGKFISLTGDCIFKQETLDRCLRECVQPIDVRENGMIQIWREPVVGVKYIAGADCSDEGGEGVNCLVILDPQTGFEMAELYADISADRFASMVYDICKEYNNPLLGVERNSNAGGAVTQKLTDLGYENLYKDDKGKVGWYTFANAIPPKVNRYTMLLEYEEAVRMRKIIVESTDAIGEMSTFVRDSGGKYQHRPGCKDDRVMARAICWQMRKAKPHSGNGFFSFKRTSTSYA